MRELSEWGLGFWCAALAFAVSFCGTGASAQDRAVVLMVDGGRREGLGEALTVELAARQTEVRAMPAPGAGTTLARASEAQAAARQANAEAAIWVDEAPAAQGGGAMVRAVGRDREEIRHAPLPQPLAVVEPRVFAVVAASLVDEIVSPPEPPITLRIQVAVEAGGRPVHVETLVPNGAGTGPTQGSAPVEVAPAPPAPPAAPAAPAAPVIVVPPEAATPTPTPTPPAVPAPPQVPDEDVRDVAFGIDFVPYVGMSSFSGGRERRRISLGVLGAITHHLDGIGLASIAHIDTGSVRGWELSGVANLNAGPLDGTQIAGVANITAGPVDGLQLAGVANLGGGDVDGMQLAGVANVANGTVDGTQISGGVNFARGDVDGAQIGLVNVSSGRVRGAQIGLVNVADDADVAIGLVSILWNGRTQIEAIGTERGMGIASIKHGSRYFHSIYGVGVRPDGNDTDAALVLGLGGRAYLSDNLHLDIDGTCAWLRDDTDGADHTLRVLSTARAMLGYRIMDGLTLVGGVSMNVLVTDDPSDLTAWEGPATRIHGGDPTDDPALVIDEFETHTMTWPGVSLGVQIF